MPHPSQQSRRVGMLSLSLPRSVGCPISRSFFARCGIPRTLTFFSTFGKKHVERCGIPYLAKNERDMGHPTLLGRDKDRMGHPYSVAELNLDKTPFPVH